MRALVTGSAGFVGRHVVKALARRDYEIVMVDIADGNDCRDLWHPDAPSLGHFDLVVHCAAVVGGRTMIDGEPLRLAVEDLTLDAELFRWALRTRPGRIVYFSSSAAYPTHWQRIAGWPLYETLIGSDCDWYQPDQTYGWVKLTGERLAAEANALGIRTHVFRPFSGYGADQDDSYPFPAIMRRAREWVIADVADRAIGNPPAPFTVWGDPGSARDWMHVDDVVACVLAAIDADDIGPMNICTGVATTFEHLATLALVEAGARVVPHIVGDTSKPTGVFWRVGDPTRMQQVYTPKITIAEGVRRAMEEMR